MDRSGEIIPVQGKIGDNVMYLAHRHDIEVEGKFLVNYDISRLHVSYDKHMVFF